MSRIVCKLSPCTLGGCIYQRKQYKKRRYRKAENRQINRLNKAIDKMFCIAEKRGDG